MNRGSKSESLDNHGNGRSSSPWNYEEIEPGRTPERHVELISTIENKVIPRLLKAHRENTLTQLDSATPAYRPTEADIAYFADLTLAHDPTRSWQYVDHLRRHGINIEAILLELFTPAARLLGDRWSDDTLSFVDVTVGLCRLQEILHELSPTFCREIQPNETVRRKVLLIPIAGEQHNFGLLMVAEFFRKAGWEPYSEPVPTQAALEKLVSREVFHVIGYSISAEARLAQLTASIESVRRRSRNPDVIVLVGGRVFLDRPELAAEIGADGTACDARQAVSQAQSLV